MRSLVVVPDEVDAIVRRSTAPLIAWVVTSGASDHHDDVTVRAVALAMGRSVVGSLSSWRCSPAGHPGRSPRALRSPGAGGHGAPRPAGAPYPVLSCDGVFLLPGIPALFRLQLETVLATLPRGQVHLRSLYVSRSEAEIASALDRVALGTPEVDIGSYPAVAAGADHRVRITVEGDEATRVDAVVARLREELPPDAVLRVE